MGQEGSSLGKLSAEELELVKSSWRVIMDNAGTNGGYIFNRFLETYNYYPYFKRFSGIGRTELPETKVFRDHSLLIMNTIDSVLRHAENTRELKIMLMKIGKKHANRNLTEQQFLELKSIIVDIMDKKFHLPRETLRAWSTAFDISYVYIFRGLHDETRTRLQRNEPRT